MTMIELALEYKESALMIKKRIFELKALLKEGNMCEMDKLRLRARIDTLDRMERDTKEIAAFMERYYDRRYKKNGRYSV